jgi:cold shock CspA family protein
MSTEKEIKAVQKVKKSKRKIRGIVCKWIPSKGYGFIRIPGQEDDLYVHSSNIIPRERNNLNIGEIVTFFIHTSKKSGRTKAIRVRGNGAGFTVNEYAGFTGVNEFPTGILSPLTIFQKSNNNNNEKVNHDNEEITMKKNEERATEQLTFEEAINQTDTDSTSTQPSDKSIAHHFQSDEIKQEITVRLKPEELKLWENFKALSKSIPNTYAPREDGENMHISMPMPMQNMQHSVPFLYTNPNMTPMNGMNPPMMPMDGSYTQLRVSYDSGNQLFPTGQNIQVEQIPYMNPNMGMRASYY